MIDALAQVEKLAVLVFAVSSMLSVGLGHHWRDVLGPLRNRPAVIRALLSNFVAVPLLMYAILQVLPLDRALATGLFLVATAAGAPFVIKLTEAAGSNVALSATLLVLLVPVTIVYMPLVVPLGLPQAKASAGAIATPLVLTMLLPLAVGLLMPAKAKRSANRLQPLLSRLSIAALVALIVTSALNNWSGIRHILFSGAIFAVLLLIVGAFIIGYASGGRNRASREVLGLGTSQRNIAAATVVASQSVGDLAVVSMVIVTSLAGFAILFPIAALMRRRQQQESRAT